MYIEKVPNRNSKPAYLLRTAWREGKKTHKETLANLSALSIEQIELLRRVLKHEKLIPPDTTFNIMQSHHHGHVHVILTAMRKLKFFELIASHPSRSRDLIVSMVVARILKPSSKLAVIRWWHDTTLPMELTHIADSDEDDLYTAMDWLLKQKKHIEKKLANRYLTSGGLVLYDLSSSYMEGECCNLAKYGYSRDRKKGKKQVNYGLLTDKRGCPIAVDIFAGNIKDSTTLTQQVEKVRSDFKLKTIVLVGDRGMITQAHIDYFKEISGIDWITALKKNQIKVLAEDEVIHAKSFFSKKNKNLFEAIHPDYPGERLIICRNEKLAVKLSHDRNSLISKTEEKLKYIQSMIKNGKIIGKDKIGVRIGKEINQFKVGKLFDLFIEEQTFNFEINQEKLKQEVLLDGIYVIRTAIAKKQLDELDVIRSYKQLCNVERAFRSFKMVDLKIRPVYHYADNRVKAHILLCMLAYYVQWHMKEAWSPLLFNDEETDLKTRDPVLPARPSSSAVEKAKTKRLSDGSEGEHLIFRRLSGFFVYFLLNLFPIFLPIFAKN